MNKPKNIYNYKIPKSMNEETHFFLTKGRITFKSLFLRLLFVICTYAIFYLGYTYYALPKYKTYGQANPYDTQFKSTFIYYKTFVLKVLPSILFLFISIQAVKRIHDVNKSGWFFLFPIYNIVLLFSKGTIGNNDFGIDPNPIKVPKYFDEIKKTK